MMPTADDAVLLVSSLGCLGTFCLTFVGLSSGLLVCAGGRAGVVRACVCAGAWVGERVGGRMRGERQLESHILLHDHAGQQYTAM